MANIEFIPKTDKIIETILYINERKRGLDHYHILKIIYLADKEHVKRYGRPISFDNFQALKFGPIPTTTYDLLKAALLGGELPFSTKKLSTKHIVINVAHRKSNLDYLSESDIEILNETISRYGDYTFNELKNLTHKDKAWIEAWESRPHGKESNAIPFERIIPRIKGRKELVENLEAVCQFI